MGPSLVYSFCVDETELADTPHRELVNEATK